MNKKENSISEEFRNIQNEIKASIQRVVKELYDLEFTDFDVAVPDDPKWGDYSSNIALTLAPHLKQNPSEIAKNLSYRMEELEKESPRTLMEWSCMAAPNGFLNFKMSESWLQNILKFLSETLAYYGAREIPLSDTILEGKRIMVEYTDPNPFKLFHIGHLMPNAVGESLARLFEYLGAEVKKSSYQGDAGMHVAKSIWGMIQQFEGDLTLESVSNFELKKRVEFLGECYALGATEYKKGDEGTVQEIKNINYLVYMSAQEFLQESQNWVPQVNYKKYLEDLDLDYVKIKALYNAGRAWSLEYFETVYEVLGTDFDFYYFESMTGEYGYKVVKEYLEKGVFEKDKGAIIFRGSDYDLHTRVFINSQGLPTYEAKDLGLVYMKRRDFNYDLSYVVTAVEQKAYFEVVFKALEQIDPALALKQIHVAHGMLNFVEGKMSSRTGNIISADELISQLSEIAYDKTANNIEGVSEEEKHTIAQKIAVSALKYAILKQQLGKNITYDRKKSLELQGNTGPYLQYTFVRVQSVLEEADFKWEDFDLSSLVSLEDFTQEEELLLRKLIHFNEEVRKSAQENLPSYLCTYLHELAGLFNTFYGKAPILRAPNDELRSFRLCLTNSVGVILKKGLYLLGIETVNKM